MEPTLLRVRAADGWTLILRAYRSPNPRAALLCGHAMMTDGSYFDKPRGVGLASWLAEQGINVYVGDFRGHGLSGPHAHEGARWSFDDLYRLDWPAFRAAAAADVGCREDELCALGHSLGGLVLAAAAVEGWQPARGIFLTVNRWNLHNARWNLRGVRERALTMLLERVTSGDRPFPARRWRLGNVDESPAYLRQVTGWWRSGRFSSLDGQDLEAGLRDWQHPAVAVCADADWMCLPDQAAAFVAPAKGKIAMVVEGKPSGLAFCADHFGLITREPGNAFHRRLVSFLETGKYIHNW